MALVEDGQLSELFVERGEHRSLAGNIYKGRVTRVLPGMQAAFVDIGLERAGFLHVSDFRNDLGTNLRSLADVVGEDEVETDLVDPADGAGVWEAVGDDLGESPLDSGSSSTLSEVAASRGAKGPNSSSADRRRRGAPRARIPIEQQLRRNQDIIVQIAKEPMGTKGSRLTSVVSLPGRYLVYMPTSPNLGVSRRIESAEERRRLRDIVSELRPPQGGFIVRTACEGITRREIQRDISFLTKLWNSIVKKYESAPSPSILYSDLDLTLRVVRDLFSSQIDRLWCDDREAFDRITQFVLTYMPRLRGRLSFYERPEPISDYFKIEPQIEQALDRRVDLKSGGYLIFDQAEALTAIDVNTGRFVGKRNQDETVLKTNLEAADEVVRQLRLRNIGGIIVVDFIDMAREADRRKVSEGLAQALKRDKARTSVLKISEFGLVQMTRKRTRESLEELLTVACPRCHARGVTKSVATLAIEALRAIGREALSRALHDMVIVKLNPDVARYLYDVGARDLATLEKRLGIKIVLRSMEGLEADAFQMEPAPAAA